MLCTATETRTLHGKQVTSNTVATYLDICVSRSARWLTAVLDVHARVATIYAYDVLERSGSPFLANRRVFAYALRGIPMGVKCDAEGNVFAGCADGLEVWNSGGCLLGVIEIGGESTHPGNFCPHTPCERRTGLNPTNPGGVSNFCFSPGGREMFLCCETRLYRLHFGVDNYDDQSMNFF